MRATGWLIIVLMLLFTSLGFAQDDEVDVAGAKDHALMSRLPGYFIGEYETYDFNAYTSPYFEGENVWEGQMTKIGYTLKEGSGKRYSAIQVARKLLLTLWTSSIQVARNYENAVKKLGGRFLFQEEQRFAARIDKAGAVTYVEVTTYDEGQQYQLLLVEQKGMQDEVVIDAATMGKSISEDGKIAVYGMYFDTGKAVLKPESEPTLAQIVALLQQNPTLKLFVVGHTDSVGQAAANMTLSANRAAAVVAALTGKGIGAGRLSSAGVGPYSPVASNRSEEGKARNRRVELVEMTN